MVFQFARKEDASFYGNDAIILCLGEEPWQTG